MKRLLMGLMLLMTAGAASAEWTLSSESDDANLYVDKGTIRRNGNFVKMWSMADFKKMSIIGDISIASTITQSESDCKEEKLRVLAITFYMGRMGKERGVFTHSDDGKWVPISPGSSNETLWKIACGK